MNSDSTKGGWRLAGCYGHARKGENTMVCEEFKDGHDLGEVGLAYSEAFAGDEVDEDFA